MSVFSGSPYITRSFKMRVVTVTDLVYRYSEGTSITFPGFSLEPGEQLLLLGESGSGKTTLLHLLGGLLRNYEGSMSVGGKELAALSETELDHFRGRNLGFVFQRNHLISALTVEQNLLMPQLLSKLPTDRARVADVLGKLGLKQKMNSRISALSQGQAQRVAIARAIMNRPPILLADEPTSALDDRNCAAVTELILDAAKESNATLIIATHDKRLKDKITKRVLLS
jgi:ABC-type lipoprotein export system ATPase subunit